MRLRASSGSTAQAFLARLGATRGGSSGILGTAAATARRAARPPCRARPAPAAARSTAGAAAMSAHGSPRRRTRSGTVRMVRSFGDHRLDLLPGERRRDLAARAGPGEPGAEDGLVGRVLVEVDEDAAAALLLPPVGGDQVGEAALQLAGQGDGGGAHLHRVPARLEPEVHVQAVVARRLRVAAQAELVEHVAAEQGDGAHLVEADAGRGVEVDAQLVGVGGVGGEVGPQVQAEAADVHRPHDVGDVGHDERVGGGAVGGGDGGRLQPVRRARPGCASGRRTCRWRRRGSAAAWRAARRRCSAGGRRPRGSTRRGRTWWRRGPGSTPCPAGETRTSRPPASTITSSSPGTAVDSTEGSPGEAGPARRPSTCSARAATRRRSWDGGSRMPRCASSRSSRARSRSGLSNHSGVARTSRDAHSRMSAPS